jgi:hypothetical protein
MNRGRSLVFGRWLRKHGVSQVKVAMKDLIVALFAPQAIAIYPNKMHKLAEYCYKFIK